MDSLLDRMRAEIAQAQAAVIMPTAVTAWSTAADPAEPAERVPDGTTTHLPTSRD
ncbi:hypothetical protein AB0J21_22970 [Streptomyces sp. NPDC049954]|uniref:hypothetical protein n=1 Tax=Streptomyces sp. NPDC049954 TaxID=3155779 RepID=UPI0034399F5B